ncbi:MAG: hypothetical protein ACRC7N_10510 [Clostridium sp.]
METNTDREYILSQITDRLGTVVKEHIGCTMESLYKELDSQITLLTEMTDQYNKIKKRIKVSKTRWVKDVLESPTSEINKLLKSCNIQYEQVKKGIISIDDFRHYFKANTPAEYESMLLKDIRLWENDESFLLSDFEYFPTRAKRSKAMAINNDILYLYKKFSVMGNVTMAPSVLSIFTFDPTNRALMFSDDQISKHEIEGIDIIQSFQYSDDVSQESLIVNLEKNTYLRSKQGQVAVDLVTQIALLKLMKYFNNIDRSVISYFFKIFSYKAILEKRVVVTIAEIASAIGLSLNKRNREAVKESLIKLGGMKLEYNNKDYYLGGALFDVYIEKEEDIETNKSQRVTVVCGSFLNDLMFMNSSYNFDTEVYDCLNSVSQQYALWLQKRRLNVIVNDNIEIEDIPFDVMTSPVRWNTSRTDRKRDKVLETLEELKGNNLIIKDYEFDKKTGRFKVQYISLPNQVIKGISANKMNTGMFIDGKVLKIT